MGELVAEASPLTDHGVYPLVLPWRLRAGGSILHDFYNGAERSFERIARIVDEHVPSDEHWHQTLLAQMAAPLRRTGVRKSSPKRYSEDLDKYLRFRHRFRNIYGPDLDWSRLVGLLRTPSMTRTAPCRRSLAPSALTCAGIRPGEGRRPRSRTEARSTMPGRRAHVERVDEDRFRLVFGRPLAAEVALMYFGFYPDTQLLWSKGRVTAIVAPSAIYEHFRMSSPTSAHRRRYSLHGVDFLSFLNRGLTPRNPISPAHPPPTRSIQASNG